MLTVVCSSIHAVVAHRALHHVTTAASAHGLVAARQQRDVRHGVAADSTCQGHAAQHGEVLTSISALAAPLPHKMAAVITWTEFFFT